MKNKPKIGIQNSVMAFAEPFCNEEYSEKYWRTGEGLQYPIQDGYPPVDLYIQAIKSLGADLYIHHTMPEDKLENEFVEKIKQYDLNYIMANEFRSINKQWKDNTNRGNVCLSAVQKAKEDPNFVGLIYDETEHIQLHSSQYGNNDSGNGTARYQWANPVDKSPIEVEKDISAAVVEQNAQYGQDVDMFSEHVFPVMYHVFSRGKMNPCPKLLKEEFQSLQLSSAMGASTQYKRKLGVCVDLWGMDIGEWFQRTWAFPGHTPTEFYNALKLAYFMSPDFLFVENIDILFRYINKEFINTEFGDLLYKFTHEFVPNNPLPYKHSDLWAKTALIRSDDCQIADTGNLGTGRYGGNLYGDYKTFSAFEAFNLLSHGKLPINGLTYFLPQFSSPKGNFPVTTQTQKLLPRVNGEKINGWENTHKLFYPMDSVLVFDEYAEYENIELSDLIVVCGSHMTQSCLDAVYRRAKEGATVILADWFFEDRFSELENVIKTNKFDYESLKDKVGNKLGDKDLWTYNFGQYQLQITNQTGDGESLEFKIIEK